MVIAIVTAAAALIIIGLIIAPDPDPTELQPDEDIIDKIEELIERQTLEERITDDLHPHLTEWATKGYPDGYMERVIMDLTAQHGATLDADTIRRINTNLDWFRKATQPLVNNQDSTKR